MSWFRNLKIRIKLLSCFIILAIFTGVVGLVGINAVKNVNESSQRMYHNNFVPSQDLQVIRNFLQEVRSNHLLAVYQQNSETYQKNMDAINNIIQQSNERLGKYETTIQTEQERILFENLKSSLNNYREERDRNLELIGEQKYDQALADLSKVTLSREKVDEALRELIDYNDKAVNNSLKSDEESYVRQTTTMIVIIVLVVISAITLGIFLSNLISRPINKMVQAAQQLALGDINAKVDAATKDEVGKLAEAFSTMIYSIRSQALVVEKIAAGDLTVETEIRSENDLMGKKLSELIRKNNEVLANIALASEQVADGSKQISDSSIALSSGATEQASAIEQLTASLEEISEQTRLNAKNADQVNELTSEAKNNASRGNLQMEEMLKAMEGINESSENISKIIKVIDDIAFQTNILALNAAVEAARAGQHGKGFAVVAEEVRNLAARSANAAKETTEMIEASIKKAEGGTKIAKETAGAFQTIVNRVEDIAKLVKDIAAASNEQAIGVEQINQGIMQVSEVVQTNSATSEEGAAASEELYSQATLLKEMVGQFRLRERKRAAGRMEELSPEIAALLDDMVRQKKIQQGTDVSVKDENAGSKPKIMLSDIEFGKY